MKQAADVPSAAMAPVTFVSAARDRATLLMFCLGFATCLPMSWGWYLISHAAGLNSADYQINVGIWRWLTITGVTLVALTMLLLAPMLDRVRAPLFRSLGHRAAWAASAILFALVMTIVFAAGVMFDRGFVLKDSAILWVFVAVPVAALVLSATDALRIELRPGRAQALMFLAQLFGALIAYRTLDFLQALEPRSFVLIAASISAMLAIGLIALLAIRIAEPPLMAATEGTNENATVFSPVLATLGRPWAAYFRRHGAAGAPMLGAIALYAIAGSVIEYLGALGHVREISPVTRGDENQLILDAGTIIKPAKEILALIGGALAAFLALRVSPFRAFFRLIGVLAAFALVYLVLKVAGGFTVGSVIGMYLFKTALMGAELVTYAIAAAALTARPNTAGQYAILGFVVGAAWLRSGTYDGLIDIADGYLLPVVALLAAIGAATLLRLSAWLSRRRRMQPVPQPAG